MADTDVQVTFGADTSALTAGTNVAKSEVDRLIQSIALLQKTVGAAAQATTSELTAAINGLGSRAASTAPQVRQMADAVQSLSHAGAGGHGTIFGMQSGVFLELRALLDEALSGRMRNFEGSFARLMGMVGPSIVEFAQANAALVGFGAAAAAAAAAVLYLGVQEAKTREENEQLMASASAGQFQRTEEQANQLRTAFVTLSGESQSSANDILASFDKLGAGGAQLATALIPYMKALAKAEGDDVGEEAKKLVARFSDLNGAGLKYLESVHSVTEAERQHYVSLIATGQRGQAWEIILRAMESTLGDVAKKTTEMTAAHNSADYALGALSTAAGVEVDMMKASADADAATKKATEELTASLNAARSAFGSLADESSVASATLVTNANKVADSYDRIGAAARKISGDSSTLFAGIFESVKSGDMEEATRLLGALPKVVSDAQVNRQQSADPLGLSRDAIKQAEDDIKQWQATTGASQDAVRAHSAQIWKQMASDSNLSIAQQHDAYQKYLDQVIAGQNAASKSGDKAAKDQLGADRSAIEESFQLTKAENQEKIKDASDALSHHRISAAEYVATVKDALDAELSATREFYAQEEALANQSLTQKANLVRKEALEEKRIMNELTDAQRKAADEEQKSWDKVNSAFDSQVNGLLKGTENFRTAMKNIAESIIEAQIKTGLNSLLTGIEGVGGKALGGAGQGNGIMSALMAALGLNTVATTANTTATAASSGGGALGFLGGIGHLFGFATGTPYVQQTGIAMIHAGERIVPANLNNPAGLASMLGPSGDSGSGSGSTSVSVSPQIHIHGESLDGASVAAFWRNNRGDIAKQLHQASREGALLGLRRLQR